MPSAIDSAPTSRIKSALVRADRADLQRLDAGRDLFAEVEALHVRAALELVQPRLGALDHAAEVVGELLPVAQVVAVAEQNALRRLLLERVQPLVG
jgi:hypothetical protein